VPAARYASAEVTFYRSPSDAGPRQAVARAPKKAFTRRRDRLTPRIRRGVQWSFLLLNLWIGVQFYLFVRYYETAGQAAYASRPAGVEGWLPIAGLMNLKYFVATGQVPQLHPAGFFLLAAFIAVSFAFRKAFCSWLCPIGTISEWLWQGGTALFGRNLAPPWWLDLPLRGPKYLLLAFFAWAIARMSATDIVAFLQSPYGVIADVKMLDFFRHLGTTGAGVIAVLVVLSILVKNAWCRYLCPYGALMGMVALLSPTRIRRNADACIDCAKCAKACPSRLPVDRLLSVSSAECTGCLDCVAACPAAGALDLSSGRGWRLSATAVAVGIVVLFGGLVGYAKLSGRWDTEIHPAVYFELVPKASELGHPPVQ